MNAPPLPTAGALLEALALWLYGAVNRDRVVENIGQTSALNLFGVAGLKVTADQLEFNAAVAAIRARYRAQESVLRWQPMTTAPKTRPILGKFSETHIEGVEWSRHTNGWVFLTDGDTPTEGD